jgi:two-component system LytT family response regulator
MIRALIVDDERMARKRIRTLLARDEDVEVVRECADGASAVAAIEELRPDLVFLDVQMPEVDGFGVVRALDVEPMPLIVFVTAFDKYAIAAFEVNALDYLPKPFDRERFAQTMARVRRQLATSAGADGLRKRLAALLERLDQPSGYATRLLIKSGGRITFLRCDEIDWIEAAGNYVKVHAGRDVHMLHEPLTSLAKRLDPARFARIHRSTVVNIDRIRELQPWFHGDAIALLRDGTKLNVSRTYRAALEAV